LTLYPRDDILLLYRLYTDDEFHTNRLKRADDFMAFNNWSFIVEEKKIFKETSRNILIQRQKAF